MGPELKIIGSSPNLAGAEREGGGLALLTYRDEDPKQVLSVPKTLASPLYLSIPISSKSVPEDPALAKEPHVRSLSYSVNKDPQLDPRGSDDFPLIINRFIHPLLQGVDQRGPRAHERHMPPVGALRQRGQNRAPGLP